MIVKTMGYRRTNGNSADAAGAMMAHIKYILYRERGPTEGKRSLFGPDGAVSDRHAAVRELTAHFGRGIAYHKLMLSPKSDERSRIEARGPGGWEDWTREVMREAGARVGKDLHWVATKHSNTANPHVHVVVAGTGVAQAGRMGKTGVRSQHREVQFRRDDFRALEKAGREQSGMRDRADVQQQLHLFRERDRAYSERDRTPTHERDAPEHGGRER